MIDVKGLIDYVESDPVAALAFEKMAKLKTKKTKNDIANIGFDSKKYEDDLEKVTKNLKILKNKITDKFSKINEEIKGNQEENEEKSYEMNSENESESDGECKKLLEKYKNHENVFFR